ncbi:hypothetical protein DPMN_004684 [Dreissena polymorpha]|uniref:Uncharacterized protein n=1 Tax=Dreissena polymorpha TaxID=45954 RepID=A0A9D4MQN7_DREPO|nr:hypothetical protein DPMN_004684 [Dreissena polymorpha]
MGGFGQLYREEEAEYTLTWLSSLVKINNPHPPLLRHKPQKVKTPMRTYKGKQRKTEITVQKRSGRCRNNEL